jgi:5'-nucleotidase
MKKSVRLFSLVAMLILLISAVGSAGAKPAGTVAVQILALNDFHGNLIGPINFGPSSAPIPAGGVEYLGTHIDNLRAANPNTVVVSAGDMIGASPLISALFHDEPTIEAFNAIGLDFNAVGNHEFDEGIYELIRMQEGGCHPVDGCLDGMILRVLNSVSSLQTSPGRRITSLSSQRTRSKPLMAFKSPSSA